MKKILFYSGIYLLNILFVDSEMIHPYYQWYNSRCADYGNDCDPHYKEPCCNRNLVCKKSNLYENIFYCTNKKQLGQCCETNEDCNRYIFHSECSKENKCACRSGTLQTSKISCSPLLGGFCADNEECGPDNSICFDNICECDDGYLPLNQFECVPTLLGTSCKNNTDCEAVKYAECLAGNICTCTEGTVEINPSRCITDPDFICESDSQCKGNTICTKKKCRCKPGWKLGPDDTCVFVHLGMYCESNEYCSNFVRHSICSIQKKCECDRFHYPTNNSLYCVSKINDACKSSETCKSDIIFCINDECQCQPNYTYNGFNCVKTVED